MNKSINTSAKEAIYLLKRIATEKSPPVCLMGNLLLVLKESSMFASLKDLLKWVSSEYGIEERKAHDLIAFAKKVDEIGASIDVVVETGVNWTHLRFLTSIITKDNVAYWMDRASKLTVVALKQEVEAAKTAEAA